MTFSIPSTINELDRLQAAQLYHDRLGWAVHPLMPPDRGDEQERGKKPILKGWRHHRPEEVTQDFLKRHFNGTSHTNVGCVVRPPFIHVDLDSKPDAGESVRAWLSTQAELAHVPRERTGGGAHLAFICRDLPESVLKTRKAITSQINDKVSAELYFDGLNIVLSPSVHKSGHRYLWEVTGDIPQVSWQQLRNWFGFEPPEVAQRGRPKKEAPWWASFRGDLHTLDIVALFRQAGRLGECLDPDENKWAVRCPWEHDHSCRAEEIGSDTAIFASEPPGLRCLHAHCAERTFKDVCAWFEQQQPGLVDKHCREQRVWQDGQMDREGRPRIPLPGLDREDSEFAAEIAGVIEPKRIWFNKANRVVAISMVRHSEKAESLGFVPMEPVEARTAVEDHLQTGIVQIDQESGQPQFMARTMTRECAAGLLAAPQFKRRLPEIIRILDLPLPIRLDDGNIAYPQPGYDPRFRIYTDPTAPAIKPMSADEATHWIREAHEGFGWRDKQSLVHQLARFITPYCRGLMGWDARFPLWHYSANRPRAGKDYLAAVTHMVYEGHSCEDSALERESEETRKRITAALMSGRRMIHFANCQGHIQDACFIGAITSKMFAARNLGSTEAKADLKLPNEIEFSISANIGLTFRPDVEPRTRRISLMFAEENANGRVFPKADLHGWLLRYRSEMLSAVAALVKRWMDSGCPRGTTPFSSFPEWAAIVGGIMQVNGLGDPCLPHDDDGGLPADRQTEAMRALFVACHDKHPDRWITKGEIYDVIIAHEDHEAFGWFGDLAEKGVKTKISLQLRQFKDRELNSIVLQIDDSAAKSQQHRFRFSRSDGESSVNVLDDLFGQVGHDGHQQSGADAAKVENERPIQAQTPSNHGQDGHLGHLHSRCPVPGDNSSSFNENKNNKVHVYSTAEGNVPILPKVPKPVLIHSRECFPQIADAIRTSGSVALDVETYGPRKGDGLDPWAGDIRLLSLGLHGRQPWIIDLRATGYDLGELKTALESAEIIAHNAKFDLLWLRNKLGLRASKVFCTLTAARLLSAGTKPGNDLDKCLHRYLGVPPAPDHSRSDWGSMLLTDDQFAYAARDVAHLHELAAKLRGELEMEGLDSVGELEMELVPVIVEMEMVGIGVDTTKLREIETKARASAAEFASSLRNELHLPTLNPSSPQQLLKALHEAGIHVENTNEETLRAADDGKIIPIILAFRGAEKLAQQAKSLIECVKGDGRIHGRFDPTGTATGRFSSKDPNLQNIGRGDLRFCFVPGAGNKLIVADYSQVELRAAAAIAGETKMIEAYRNGVDLHKQTAAEVLGKALNAVTKEDRQISKSANFGLLYGQSAPGLVRYAASSYGVTLELDQAEQIRRQFFRTYGSLRQWHGESRNKADAGAREVRTVMGRRRLIPETASEWERFTALVNTPVQGGCADGMKRALVMLAERLPAEARLISTVHDEVLVEAPEAMAEQVRLIVQATMVEAMAELFPQVPIEVEAGVCEHWGEK